MENQFLYLLIGIAATFLLDCLGLLLHYTIRIPKTEWRYIGRWFIKMQYLQFLHSPIGSSAPERYELFMGWFMHYLIGVIFSVFYFNFMAYVGIEPSLNNATIFGALTLVFPYLIMQPALGYGFFARKHKRPILTPIMSILAHLTFGQFLYVVYIIGKLWPVY